MTMKKSIGNGLKDLLELVGLERRRPAVGVISAMGLVAFGAAFGASLGLLLAPSSGRRLRHDVGERLDVIRDRIKHRAADAGGRVASRVEQATRP